MKSNHLFLESLIIGSGTVLFLILALFVVFEFDSSYVDQIEYYLYWSDTGWLFLFPLLGWIVISGLIMESFSYLVFYFWERGLHKTIQPIALPENAPPNKAYYFELRNYLFSNGKASDLVNEYQRLQSKIRISRSWVMNALLITLILILRESRAEVFEPYTVPGILIAGLILVGALFAWFTAVGEEIRLLEKYNETLLQ